MYQSIMCAIQSHSCIVRHCCLSHQIWPANSPDLNPVDYKSWGVMQERVYHKPILDVIQQKQRLIDVWSGVQQDVVEEALDQWHK